MQYFIRTTGNRVYHNSYNQITYQELVYKDNKPIDDFIDSLCKISNSDSLLLEDDLILCNNFMEEVNKAVELYPNMIINFFQDPHTYYKTKITNSIISNQCTFYPKGTAKIIADQMLLEPRTFEKIKKNMYSLIENKVIDRLSFQIVQYRPHLVQHLDLDTLLFPRTDHSRRSLYFIDNIKKLGIEYEDSKKHIAELMRIRHEQFKEYENKCNNRLREHRAETA